MSENILSTNRPKIKLFKRSIMYINRKESISQLNKFASIDIGKAKTSIPALAKVERTLPVNNVLKSTKKQTDAINASASDEIKNSRKLKFLISSFQLIGSSTEV